MNQLNDCLTGEIRPNYRRLLPKRDRSGRRALRSRNPGHGRHRTVRFDERPLHKERTGICCRLFDYFSPNISRRQEYEGTDR